MRLTTNTWRAIGVVFLLLFAMFFMKVVVYLTISLVLFLIGYPITYRLHKIHIGKVQLPSALASLITLLLMLGAIAGLFMLILPPVITEIQFLSGLNLYDVLDNILEHYPGWKEVLLKFGTIEDLHEGIVNQARKQMNVNNITGYLSNIFSYSGSIVGGTLCVLFITFFLLKDEDIVKEGLMLLSPSGYEEAMTEISRTSKRMLSAYFTGLFADMLILGVAVMISLSVLDIKNAVVIAFCAGLLNVVPYIGSFITMLIAITLGMSSCISAGAYELIGPTISKIFFTLLTLNLLDAFILQPIIFSGSVKAHPLEIFIVTLMAGTIGGILGMIVALPTYTLIRIVAGQFLSHLKFFRKISVTVTNDETHPPVS